jgi:hypothetical protein
MREAVTQSQRLPISLIHLATGNNFEDLKFVKGYVTIKWNYRARDVVVTARHTDGN